MKYFAILWVLLALVEGSFAQVVPTVSVPLLVPAGAPLRLYLAKRFSKHLNAPVEAKLLTPLFAFDHQVLPAGTQVFGRVTRLDPVTRWTRIRAVLGGDFTPLHIAQVEFTSLVLPDGRRMDLDTQSSPGLNSIAPLKPPKHPAQPSQTGNTGVLASAKQQARDQIDTLKGIPDLVRGTNKKEWLYEYAMSRLPYHPQYVRSRTRFDAELKEPLSFGSETLTASSLSALGSQPAAGSIAHARLLTSVDSVSSKPGEKLQAVLEEPVFTADHHLVLPEGTIVQGSVGMVRKAHWFHHSGRLRFTFRTIELTPQVTALEATLRGGPDSTAVLRTQADLTGAEGGSAPVKVDSEGGAQAKESKTRLIGTVAALLITHRAADNDAGANHIATNGQSPNISGRTLGGGLGFGLLGSIAAQASNNVGEGLAYYGMAWSVFSTIIAPGPEVQFGRNAAIDIGFNRRAPGK